MKHKSIQIITIFIRTMSHDTVSICCQREAEGFVAREYKFQLIGSFVNHSDDRHEREGQLK